MTREELEQIKIDKSDKQTADDVKRIWDEIAKPLDGMGKFETLFTKIGAIKGEVRFDIDKRAVIVMCADNGIVEEGVSQSTQEVTAIVTENMGKGITSVCRMSRKAHVDVMPVDIGVAGDTIFENVLNKKVAPGTKNFYKEPAMTEDEALEAISVGINLVKECKNKGYDMLATGEMGIANTTTSSAIAAALLECEVEFITGKGAGLSDEGLHRKCAVIKASIEKYKLDKKDPLKILSCVGGLDIAGLAGVYIGGAIYHIPVVMDGVISAVAGLLAEALVPGTKEYMIPSHISKEPAAKFVMDALGVEPVIHGDLALGEGTGAVMLFPLLDMAMAIYEDKTTFSDIALAQYERFDEKDGKEC